MSSWLKRGLGGTERFAVLGRLVLVAPRTWTYRDLSGVESLHDKTDRPITLGWARISRFKGAVSKVRDSPFFVVSDSPSEKLDSK